MSAKIRRDIQRRAEAIIEHLSEGLFERAQVIRLSFAAMVAGESVFLLGPPGTAKSLIARRLSCALRLDEREGELQTFQYLMGRFSTPEELFGPISVQGLKQDRFVRKTEGYLPTAHIAFLDELWKASPAILNALLTALNERVFRNGTQEEPMPLRALVAASNELPRLGDGLGALWDRFVLRLWVDNIEDEGSFVQMLNDAGDVYRDPLADRPELKLSLSELTRWQEALARLPISQDATDVILSLKAGIQSYNQALEEGEPAVYVSDRRWRKVTRFLKACALLNGHEALGFAECSLLPLCLWDQPQQLPALRALCERALFTASYGRWPEREATQAQLQSLEQLLLSSVGGVRLGRPLSSALQRATQEVKAQLHLARRSLASRSAHHRVAWADKARFSDDRLQEAVVRGQQFGANLTARLAEVNRRLGSLSRTGPRALSELDALSCLPRPPEQSWTQALPAGWRRTFTLKPKQMRSYDEGRSRSLGARWRALQAEGVHFNMVYCPPGRFEMGAGEGGFTEHGTYGGYQYARHEVELTRGYWLAETPVTQALYLAVMGPHRSSQRGPSLPVDQVTWYDAAAFCHRLSALFGLPSPYSRHPERPELLSELNLSEAGFRLPTEAEWVYAAQADHPKRYAGSEHLNGVGWAGQDHDGKLKPVKRLQPNAWGLYDLSGNVQELCLDRGTGDNFTVERSGLLIDPLDQEPHYNVYYLRGGSAERAEQLARVDIGDLTEWGFPLNQVGFRFALPA